MTTDTASLISTPERITFRKDSMMIDRYREKIVQAFIPNEPFMGDEMCKSSNERIRYVIGVISKRRWWIIVPYCFSMLVGLAVSVILPKDYEATALIMAQPERAPEMLVQHIAKSEVEDRARSLSQQILSRRNLEHVINEDRLFSDPASRSMMMEEKVESLRKRIRVALIPSGDSKAANAFSISFRDSNPELTMRVANKLATLFVEESRTSREEQAVGSRDSLETELESMRKDLEEKEQALGDYRLGADGPVVSKRDVYRAAPMAVAKAAPVARGFDAYQEGNGSASDGAKGSSGAKGGTGANGSDGAIGEPYDDEWTTLWRDYKNQKAVYNALLNRKLDADIAIDLEKKRKNELFRVLDMARMPKEPVSEAKCWWLKGLPLLSLAVAFGLIFLLEVKGAWGGKRRSNNASNKEYFAKSNYLNGNCERPEPDEFQNVNFSAFYHRQSVVGVRSVIAIYAHIQDYMNAVVNDVLKFKELFGDQTPLLKEAKNFSFLKEGVLITVVPQCDVIDFCPKQITLRWESPFIRFLFDFTPGEILADEPLSIKFSFQVEGFQIAHLNLEVEVVDKFQGRGHPKPDAFETGFVYEKIFVSYSLKDKEAVEGYRKIFEAFKKDIFIDTYSIYPPEKRSEIVGSLFKECDAFYLFWSENAAASERVRSDFLAAIEAIGTQRPADTFFRPICWETPLHPEPWPELKGSGFTYLPKLKQDSIEGNKGHSSGLQVEAVSECFSYLKASIGPDSEDFERAVHYVGSDPKGSLNKSRIVLESLILDAYRREMGRSPRLNHLQRMLEDNQFTRRIDRNVQFRMAYVRNFGNMGSHAGEVAEPNDAVDCLRNLICLIQWHKNNYSENHKGSLCNSLTHLSEGSLEGHHPSPPASFSVSVAE